MSNVAMNCLLPSVPAPHSFLQYATGIGKKKQLSCITTTSFNWHFYACYGVTRSYSRGRKRKVGESIN